MVRRSARPASASARQAGEGRLRPLAKQLSHGERRERFRDRKARRRFSPSPSRRACRRGRAFGSGLRASPYSGKHPHPSLSSRKRPRYSRIVDIRDRGGRSSRDQRRDCVIPLGPRRQPDARSLRHSPLPTARDRKVLPASGAVKRPPVETLCRDCRLAARSAFRGSLPVGRSARRPNRAACRNTAWPLNPFPKAARSRPTGRHPRSPRQFSPTR